MKKLTAFIAIVCLSVAGCIGGGSSPADQGHGEAQDAKWVRENPSKVNIGPVPKEYGPGGHDYGDSL